MSDRTPGRVLMIDSERSWRGGEGQLYLLMRGLCAEGWHVGLASPPGSAVAARSRELPVEQYAVPMRGTGLGDARRLQRIARDQRYDIVHAHASRAHSVLALAFALPGPRPLRVVSRRVDFEISPNPFSRWKYHRGADLYIAISRGVAEVLVYGGVAREKIRLAPSGIDPEKFAGVGDSAYLREEFGIPPGTRVVGNIAALAPHKSQVDFVRAAAALCRRRSDVRFFIVGEGELRGKLQHEIDRLGIGERVTLTGFRTDVLEVLVLFDCFVMSSYLEGLGTSILDAQFAGVPVVATRVGGIPELVDDGESGLLVPARSPQALATAIERMIDDRELRERCIAGAREKSRGYDCHQMVYKTLDAYREFHPL